MSRSCSGGCHGSGRLPRVPGLPKYCRISPGRRTAPRSGRGSSSSRGPRAGQRGRPRGRRSGARARVPARYRRRRTERPGHLVLGRLDSRRADRERARRQRAEFIAQQIGVHAQRTRALEAEHAGRSLAEQVRTLAATNAHRKELLATASHELRTPLTSILGFSEMLRSRLGEADDPAVRGDHSPQRPIAAPRRRRPVAAGESRVGGHGLARDSVGVDKLVRRSLRASGRWRTRGRVTIAWSATVADGPRRPRRPGRVVSNVVSNAVKYSDRGARHVAVATADGEVRIKVRDPGIGIPEDEVGWSSASSSARPRPGSPAGRAPGSALRSRAASWRSTVARSRWQ